MVIRDSSRRTQSSRLSPLCQLNKANTQSSALADSDSSFAISYQQTRTAQPSATPPLIDWGDEELPGAPAPVSLGGIKGQSSWLSKFLSAGGAKQAHVIGHDFEVALPGKK